MKKRLDVYCVEKGLFETRQKALGSIMAGRVLVNGEIADKAGFQVRDGDKVEIAGEECPYVSRGGLKLKAAMEYFRIDLKGKICLDVGVATGGFSDCMLKEGAKKVYGVDVGEGQLHERIRGDAKFVFLPNTNARFLKPELFPEKPEFAAVDVSFISLKTILPPLLASIGAEAELVLLVKPQFELGVQYLKKGIVKDEAGRQKAIEDMSAFIKENFKSCRIEGYTDCPVKGAKGNREFLMKVNKVEVKG